MWLCLCWMFTYFYVNGKLESQPYHKYIVMYVCTMYIIFCIKCIRWKIHNDLLCLWENCEKKKYLFIIKIIKLARAGFDLIDRVLWIRLKFLFFFYGLLYTVTKCFNDLCKRYVHKSRTNTFIYISKFRKNLSNIN